MDTDTTVFATSYCFSHAIGATWISCLSTYFSLLNYFSFYQLLNIKCVSHTFKKIFIYKNTKIDFNLNLILYYLNGTLFEYLQTIVISVKSYFIVIDFHIVDDDFFFELAISQIKIFFKSVLWCINGKFINILNSVLSNFGLQKRWYYSLILQKS